MAQFGKNPPWARNEPGQPGGLSALQNMAVAAAVGQQVGLGQPVLTQPGLATPTVYSLAGPTSSLASQHQYTATPLNMVQGLPQAVQLSQPGIALPTTLATNQPPGNTVSYPAPRAGPGPQPPIGNPTQHKQRVFTGTVTKLHDNFGFVDDDVFFQISCVKGPLPKTGDRVLVEATYNMNMPFKWNATRIQVLPNQNMSGPPVQGPPMMGPNQGRPPSGLPPSGMGQPPPLMGQQAAPPTGPPQARPPTQSRPPAVERTSFRDRERDRPRERDRDRHERRDRRSPPPRKRSRSPRRSRSPVEHKRSSPPRRRTQTTSRPQPRYQVSVPKMTLDLKEANVTVLRSRYSNMYIPSDFFHSCLRWVEGFPIHRPFTLPSQSCLYHIMHKDVEPLEPADTPQEPPDANHLYSAKVMLISTPTMDEMFRKCCGLAEESSSEQDSFVHPTRLINFLVGMKGRSEPMAIGGPWSPSLDGANPDTDPRVLINTAIRTTRTLTGIDLSKCTKWYRFAEIRYHRPEEVHKGRLVPTRVETVLIFLPDVWSCQPSRLDWETMQGSFKKQLAAKITEESRDADAQDEEEIDRDETIEGKTDPTHYSEIDTKSMKVSDLRRELECRQLSSKGLKSQLIARLTKAVKTEQEKEEQEEAEHKEQEQEEKRSEEKAETDEREEEKKKKEDDDRKKRDEKDAASREKRYQLPDTPAILVHPSTTAKSGKFDCSVMSLSVLLDYRQEDNKEHSFEVSLFAELFNEMLMRDYGFLIYKSLLAVPDKKDDKHKRDDKKDEKRDDRKDDKKDEKREDRKDEKKDDRKDDKDDKEPAGKRRRGDTEDDKEKYEKRDKRSDKDRDDKGSDDADEGDDDEDDEEVKSGKDKDKDQRRSKDKDSRKRDKNKFQTVDPHLLLAFVYFDTAHSGYLLDKDAEDLLHMIGLNLSRAQVKKLVKKVVSRDTLNYRKLTDKSVFDDGTDGEKREQDIDETSEQKALDDESLAQGNMLLMESGAEISSDSQADPKAPNMVMYKGALLDINSFMQRLEKSEKTRNATEMKLKDLQEEMDMLKTSFSSSEQNSMKVAVELQDLKKKLRDQRKSTESAENASRQYSKLLKDAQVTLSTLLFDVNTTLSVADETGNTSVKQEVMDTKETNGE